MTTDDLESKRAAWAREHPATELVTPAPSVVARLRTALGDGVLVELSAAMDEVIAGERAALAADTPAASIQ